MKAQASGKFQNALERRRVGGFIEKRHGHDFGTVLSAGLVMSVPPSLWRCRL
jgi:hypothetical protein